MSPDDPIAEAAYDELASDYAEAVETNPYNAFLEFPATSGLIPDVTGQCVLDAGCGSGHYTGWLLDQGARVVGADVSEAMLAEARDRVGDRADFHRADLAEPLPFEADSFDGIVSALALGYVRDWTATFAEFARVLRPGGWLVFSVKHPFDSFEAESGSDYFAVERETKEWAVDVPYYRRPLAAMVDPLLANDFALDALVEPQPTDEFAEAAPDLYEKESTHPVFLCIRARRGDPADRD